MGGGTEKGRGSDGVGGAGLVVGTCGVGTGVLGVDGGTTSGVGTAGVIGGIETVGLTVVGGPVHDGDGGASNRRIDRRDSLRIKSRGVLSNNTCLLNQ